MKKMDTSTRLLKTGPMSSLSESMARYNSLDTSNEMKGHQRDQDRIRIICGGEMSADGAICCFFYPLWLRTMSLFPQLTLNIIK